MRVKIEHTEKEEGRFRKTKYYVVELNVEFSEEEKAALQGLDSITVMERGVPADRKASQFEGSEDVWNITVAKLLDPKWVKEYAHHSIIDANTYENKLLAVLAELNNYIKANPK